MIFELILAISSGELRKKKFSQREIEQMENIREILNQGREQIQKKKYKEAREIYEKAKKLYNPRIDKNKRT